VCGDMVRALHREVAVLAGAQRGDGDVAASCDAAAAGAVAVALLQILAFAGTQADADRGGLADVSAVPVKLLPTRENPAESKQLNLPQ
jgi:hypothetical protein